MIYFSLGINLVALFIAIPLSVWATICTRIALEDRLKVLECMRHRPVSFADLLRELERVTFNQHLRALMLRRDPWALYDPMVPDAVRNPRVEMVMMGEPSSEAPPRVH
jgi:hypothetical protein